jgi:hypothetical protein
MAAVRSAAVSRYGFARFRSPDFFIFSSSPFTSTPSINLGRHPAQQIHTVSYTRVESAQRSSRLPARGVLIHYCSALVFWARSHSVG